MRIQLLLVSRPSRVPDLTDRAPGDAALRNDVLVLCSTVSPILPQRMLLVSLRLMRVAVTGITDGWIRIHASPLWMCRVCHSS